MPDSSLSGKKRKVTLVACQKGIEKANKALIKLGFSSKTEFAKFKFLSRTTVTKFFNQQPMQLDSFKKICEELRLKWQEIAGLTEESIKFEQKEEEVNPSPILQEGMESFKKTVRKVFIIDKPSKGIKAEITLKGDIDSLENLKIIAAILKEYSGETVEILDIREGSIKLIIKGYKEDIERLLSHIKSGELTEIDGFPVEDAQILSESAEDAESSVQKWRLVEEIITNPIGGRDLSGADLSDADLSNASLIGANLSNADLSDSDLSAANLRGADLRGAKLIGADLNDADLTEADITGANLQQAWLERANLTKTQALKTNFNQAHLTGACLEDWNIDSTTQLDGVMCDYVYLFNNHQERRPNSGEFAPGEFTKLFQEVLNTISALTRKTVQMNLNDINFPLKGEDENQVATGYMKTRFTITRDGNLYANTRIWTKNPLIGFTSGVCIILTDAAKRPIWSSSQQRYGIDGQLIGKSDRTEKWEETVPADILAITKGYYIEQTHTPRARLWEWMQSEEGLQKINLGAKLFEGNIVMTGNYYNQSGNFGIGHMSGGTIQSGAKVAGVLNEAEQQNLAEAAAQIQQLLEQLDKSYPANTTTGKMAIATEAIKQLEANPIFMVRVLSAIKAGSISALESLLNHPAASFVIAALQDLQETGDDRS